MQFSRIRLENWRNFASVDVPLQTRVFIVGANASGKSNLLDVFRFLRDLVVAGGGFQEAVLKRGGVSRIRNLAARHPNTDVVIDVEMREDDDHPYTWRYRLVFNKGKSNKAPPKIKEEKIWSRGQVILDRPDADDLADDARLTQTQLEQTFANRDFREIADFLKTINYSHIVPQLVRDPERFVSKQADPFGGDFLEQIARKSPKTQASYLKRIQQALQIAIPQLSKLELQRDDRGILHLRGQYAHWKTDDSWQTEADFSDGTLRLIGILWAMQTDDNPLLLEEPELSLHINVVRHLPQILLSLHRSRQLIISTHSHDLLTDEGIAPDEVLLLQASNVGTHIQVAIDSPEIIQELEAGFTIAEVVLPRTEPANLHGLPL